MGNKSLDIYQENLILNPLRKKINRRHFLLGIAAISTTAILPFAISCTATPKHDIHGQLTDDDYATLIDIQNHLFPKEDNSPGANEINAAPYYTWVLSDSDKDPDERSQLRDGITWVNDLSLTNFNKKFTKLSFDQKEKALRYLEEENWGKNWLSVTLTLIFEALLSDPIYGSNTNESGWKWLEHKQGIPQPTTSNQYHITSV